MEFSYNNIKKMDVVNLADGKHLGKACDMVFEFPENRVLGFYVTGGKGLHIMRQDMFLPVSAIVRVGEDVILTDLRNCAFQKGKRGSKERLCQPQGGSITAQSTTQNRRSYDEYE